MKVTRLRRPPSGWHASVPSGTVSGHGPSVHVAWETKLGGRGAGCAGDALLMKDEDGALARGGVVAQPARTRPITAAAAAAPRRLPRSASMGKRYPAVVELPRERAAPKESGGGPTTIQTTPTSIRFHLLCGTAYPGYGSRPWWSGHDHLSQYVTALHKRIVALETR
ncbi:hypothetical protein NJB14197_38750 [Mycobacterium montefiorense]|uniref:Uncharacterized protein n=1 Tax=Mycobacterium montefiorense TaxID=154654 RepID=A0AA37PPK2_9MYCO|nr:hypothetical protein MmonteBS_40010 [Mycobacterium montefiorense]GKU35500.1 hypothetical protein NJB14191_28460 [Mycobacterium montefiorense]GKU40505.1 hypothetical protein NJB14192_24920 [Mycobacterium montefiorense]GKU45008.1 hypothetical protein NJB14194_16320 [Mycobacterium montefiorense]GKU51158.1 hypothetical protein NJB14195_24040 [Mycobacterium montefiorense]